MDNRRIRSPKTSQYIARDIAEEIVAAKLEEGTPLPTEREMIERFGAGRATVREALRLLETRGAITIRPGRFGGPAVRRPRPEDLGDSLTLLLQFEGATLRDVMVARIALEPSIVRIAAKNITDSDIQTLRQSVEKMTANPDDHKLWVSENAAFHAAIARATKNTILWILIEALKSINDGIVAGVKYSPPRRRAVAIAHSKIVDALEAGNAEAAEEEMRAHLTEAHKYWEQRYSYLIDNPIKWWQ
jgi:DNA-binding FadR family transcriptional regulator